MDTVTKKDLIDHICAQTGHRRHVVKDAVQSFLDLIITELAAGKRLEFRDFGVFEIKVRAPRKAQNPKTLAPVQVPAKKTVKFKVGRLMRACLDGEPLPAREARGEHEDHDDHHGKHPGVIGRVTPALTESVEVKPASNRHRAGA